MLIHSETCAPVSLVRAAAPKAAVWHRTLLAPNTRSALAFTESASWRGFRSARCAVMSGALRRTHGRGWESARGPRPGPPAADEAMGDGMVAQYLQHRRTPLLHHRTPPTRRKSDVANRLLGPVSATGTCECRARRGRADTKLATRSLLRLVRSRHTRGCHVPSLGCSGAAALALARTHGEGRGTGGVRRNMR